MKYCTNCYENCEVFDDDQRFEADGPGGPTTFGAVYTLSTCCEAPVEYED